jgi:hypothetical protein
VLGDRRVGLHLPVSFTFGPLVILSNRYGWRIGITSTRDLPKFPGARARFINRHIPILVQAREHEIRLNRHIRVSTCSIHGMLMLLVHGIFFWNRTILFEFLAAGHIPLRSRTRIVPPHPIHAWTEIVGSHSVSSPVTEKKL